MSVLLDAPGINKGQLKSAEKVEVDLVLSPPLPLLPLLLLALEVASKQVSHAVETAVTVVVRVIQT
jgi:hypothetical protein